MGAQLYVDAKKQDAKVRTEGSRPKYFVLVDKKVSELPISDAISENPKKSNFHERDLHPLLCNF